MAYIKHYYVDDTNNVFCCELPDPAYKRHPWKEYPGLDVKIWLTDSDGVEVCLSEIPDSTPVTTLVSDCGKNAVQVLTEVEYNTVAIPYFESQALSAEARMASQNGDQVLAEQKTAESEVKLQEALNALYAL